MPIQLSFQTLNGETAIYNIQGEEWEWRWCTYEVPLNKKTPLLKLVIVLAMPTEKYDLRTETAPELLETLSKMPAEEIIVEHKINVSDPTLDQIAGILNVFQDQEKTFFVFGTTELERHVEQHPAIAFDDVLTGLYTSESEYSSCSDKIIQAPEAFYRSILFPNLVRSIKSYSL